MQAYETLSMYKNRMNNFPVLERETKIVRTEKECLECAQRMKLKQGELESLLQVPIGEEIVEWEFMEEVVPVENKHRGVWKGYLGSDCLSVGLYGTFAEKEARVKLERKRSRALILSFSATAAISLFSAFLYLHKPIADDLFEE